MIISWNDVDNDSKKIQIPFDMVHKFIYFEHLNIQFYTHTHTGAHFFWLELYYIMLTNNFQTKLSTQPHLHLISAIKPKMMI